MTLQLALPVEVEKRLQEEAKRSGLPSEAVALRLLDQHLPPVLDARRAKAIALLDHWMREDNDLTTEEAASNAEVLRQLDADRPSHRKLFGDMGKDG